MSNSLPERTYLTTTYPERDKVKALGARWDAEAGRWYVPPGRDLSLFSTWLPDSAGSESTALAMNARGIPLSRLLGGVAVAVAGAFPESVWTSAEVVRASARNGHYYLELSERSSSGEVLATARGIIWSRNATALLAEFRRVTGAELDAGIKVLLRVRPVVKAQYGLSLEIDGIDASYTLGDLEARKRETRERLKREKLFDRNRALASPWDVNAVLVIAPERGAGLGDFAKEAQRLQQHGVCEFSYSHCRFQGEGAAAEICTSMLRALATWSRPSLPDALVIIRGGGSVTDLAWLNEYALAKVVCEYPVAVFTGIGHERDSTMVDEVAHRKFDTPSKVIAYIEDLAKTRAREARAAFEHVISQSRLAVRSASSEVERLCGEVTSQSRLTLTDARTTTDELLAGVTSSAVGAVHRARVGANELHGEVRSAARMHVALAGQAVPAALNEVCTAAASSISTARKALATNRSLCLERASGQARRARVSTLGAIESIRERAQAAVRTTRQQTESLMREVAGQGPEKTLSRGFAMVRSGQGRTITGSNQTEAGADIEVAFRDGVVAARVESVKERGGEESQQHSGVT